MHQEHARSRSGTTVAQRGRFLNSRHVQMAKLLCTEGGLNVRDSHGRNIFREMLASDITEPLDDCRTCFCDTATTSMSISPLKSTEICPQVHRKVQNFCTATFAETSDQIKAILAPARSMRLTKSRAAVCIMCQQCSLWLPEFPIVLLPGHSAHRLHAAMTA